MWAALENFRCRLILVLLEVLHEQLAKLLHLAPEVCRTVPALGRVEQLIGDVGAGLGDREAEGVVGFVLDLGELARVDGVENGASVLERASLAASGGTSANPASVE